ncbi:universal stress protein [Desulfatitalea tepidiphila]|uniref:universal stress protein n=1 Tax=Desulfatitalea tepidiphila TaxID=1185843 RepID=UPI0006B57A0B|nr:universal stress protein [Desulfatitalea tepidiphila]
MLKILVYTNGQPIAEKALHFAAELSRRLAAELAVITVRSGTHAAEEPPPVGIAFSLADRKGLPHGLQILITALDFLAGRAILPMPKAITIQDFPRGYRFVCNAADGRRVAFYESFGHLVETLNHEVDEHGYDLLVVAPPRRNRLGRWMSGNAIRKLALDLQTSLLVVRGGGPDSPYLVCADGSLSARSQFSLLRRLLPAIGPPVNLIWIQKSVDDQKTRQTAQACLSQAGQWLSQSHRECGIIVKESDRPAEEIIATAGTDAVVMMGASLRHDVYRRMRGSQAMQVLDSSPASVLLVKLPPEEDVEFMKTPQQG